MADEETSEQEAISGEAVDSSPPEAEDANPPDYESDDDGFSSGFKKRYSQSLTINCCISSMNSWVAPEAERMISLERSRLKIPMMDFASMVYRPDTRSMSQSCRAAI